MTDEGGIRPQRIEFVRENAPRDTPSDPEYEIYSDRIISFPDWQPDAQVEADRGVGSYRVEDFYAGPEDHTGVTVAYRLQRPLVDGSNNPDDPITDGIQRGSDGEAVNTHTFMARESHASGGVADGGKRIFYVGRGGYVASGELPFATDTGLPIEATITYDFEIFTVFVVDQPSSSTTLDVESTDSNDNSQTVTIESEDASTTEDVSLSGTTVQTTTATFSDIDAIWLDAQTQGDVVITDGSGNELARIGGRESYDQDVGDRGIPPLGAGSHATSIGTSYEKFINDNITATNGDIGGTGAKIVSTSFTFDNNTDSDPDGRYMDRYFNEQTLEMTAEVYGPEALAHEIRGHLQTSGIDVEWQGDNTTLTVTGGTRTDSGTASKEASQGRSSTESTYGFADITLA